MKVFARLIGVTGVLGMAGFGALFTFQWEVEAEPPAGSADVPYPLTTCPVSGGDLGAMGEPVVRVYDEREVRFCCAGCVAKFEANAGQYWQQIDARIVNQQKPDYPLETCLVSGKPLDGSMGKPVDYMLGNRLVRLCCNGCVKDLKAHPERYLKELDSVQKVAPAGQGQDSTGTGPQAPAQSCGCQGQ